MKLRIISRPLTGSKSTKNLSRSIVSTWIRYWRKKWKKMEASTTKLRPKLQRSGSSLQMWPGISQVSLKLAEHISQSTILRSVHSWLGNLTCQKVQAALHFGNWPCKRKTNSSKPRSKKVKLIEIQSYAKNWQTLTTWLKWAKRETRLSEIWKGSP